MSGPAGPLARALDLAVERAFFRAAPPGPEEGGGGEEGGVPRWLPGGIEASVASWLPASGPAPSVLVDCRSDPVSGVPSPTYRLARSLGLEDVRPFAVTGPMGAEAVAALCVLPELLGGDPQGGEEAQALLVVSRSVPPGQGHRVGERPAADGVAGLWVRRGGGGAPLRAVALGHDTPHAVVAAVLERGAVRWEDLRWLAGHALWRERGGDVPDAADKHPARRLTSHHAPLASFGGLEPFAEWAAEGFPGGPGLLLFAGPEGAWGSVLVGEGRAGEEKADAH